MVCVWTNCMYICQSLRSELRCITVFALDNLIEIRHFRTSEVIRKLEHKKPEVFVGLISIRLFF